jgi:hypothetical protein
MLIEISYFPEQVVDGMSTYDRYKQLYDEGLPSLMQVISDVEGEETDTESSGGMPHFHFQEDKGGLVGWQTNM